MAFARPTLNELVQEAEASLASRLPGADTKLRRAFLAVLARVVAGVAFGLYGFIDWVSRQILPDTADISTLPRHGNLRRIPQKGKAQAEGIFRI